MILYLFLCLMTKILHISQLKQVVFVFSLVWLTYCFFKCLKLANLLIVTSVFWQGTKASSSADAIASLRLQSIVSLLFILLLHAFVYNVSISLLLLFLCRARMLLPKFLLFLRKVKF